ncbi:MAG TPA: hypothetical protein VEJ84_11860 [Acidimicrobiales bacterium]|nr:hypothetical protein [Acidimicrobiales bacterium]
MPSTMAQVDSSAGTSLDTNPAEGSWRLVTVSAPAALWEVQFGNPEDVAVDEPPLHLPSVTVKGVTVIERTTPDVLRAP